MSNKHSLDPLEIAAFTMAAFGLLLFVSGFLIPPIGEVHPSVLKGIGELLGFVSVFFVWYAVKNGRSAIFRHGDTSAEIKATNHKNEDDGELHDTD